MVWYKEIKERERDMNGGVVGGLNIYRGGGGVGGIWFGTWVCKCMYNNILKKM